VTTSGTATANLHPAVLEADLSGVPLLLLTADRPPELRGTGANQTVDQLGLYGGAVRLFVELGTPGTRVGDVAAWRSRACRVLAAALGDLGTPPGPVHLNVGLREPLVPDGTDDWLEPLDGRPGDAPLDRPGPGSRPDGAAGRPAGPHGRVLGDGARGPAAAALSLAPPPRVARRRRALVGRRPDARGAARPRPAARRARLGGGAPPRSRPRRRPPHPVAVGRAAHRRLALRRRRPAWAAGPTRPVPRPRVLPAVPAHAGGDVDDGWLDAWRAASAAVDDAVTPLVEQAVVAGGLVEPVLAGRVAGAVAPDGLLVVGSSKPVRDLFLVGPRSGAAVLANRGAAGIDGTVSTAVGAALGHAAQGGGATYALLGDLTFLHDANGLVLGPDEPRADLTLVVVNNDGGAIFSLLEQSGPEHAHAFERVFGTPHGVDLGALCAATGTPHVRVDDVIALDDALVPAAGLRVVEARTDRRAAAELDRAMHAAARRALAT
jgi:2-succinyl-5-enolpyruvyl-6-hydroxy-3-cyclohexene-1-carboxylate synthase